MYDLISRKAVIDYIGSMPTELTTDGRKMIRRSRLIEFVTSAQPEILRCGDCLMHKVCRFEIGLGENGFCSQAKRKEE